jgi:hypothetical protein
LAYGRLRHCCPATSTHISTFTARLTLLQTGRFLWMATAVQEPPRTKRSGNGGRPNRGGQADHRTGARARHPRNRRYARPYKNASYASEQGEAVRQALNGWIPGSRAFDGVIDFASSVADKTDPLKIDSAFNDGDKPHPNDAGVKAMKDAVDLLVITGM